VAGFGPASAIAKDVRSAQMMMERGINPSIDNLSDASIPVRKLMKAAS